MTFACLGGRGQCCLQNMQHLALQSEAVVSYRDPKLFHKTLFELRQSSLGTVSSRYEQLKNI